MEQKHKYAIQKNFSSLVERTDLDLMVNALYERGVFSEPMIEPYRDIKENERSRKRKLYREIMKRGPLAFGHLIDTLGELGYWDLLSDLDPENPLASFRRPPISSLNHIPLDRDPEPTEGFVSISNERHKTKTEQQKAPAQQAPAPTPTPALDNAVEDTPVIPEIKVVKSTSFIEENDNDDLPLYKTRGTNRGVLLVFTYVNFENNIEKYRNGADVDCKMLKELFSEMGFRVLSYNNLHYEATIDTLCSLGEVLVDVESVFIVVSSHGYERRGSSDTDIRCSDGKLISYYDIMAYFSNITLPKLIGIPKVFIFQVCRGNNIDYAAHGLKRDSATHMTMPEGDGAVTDGIVVEENANSSRAPRFANYEPKKAPLYSDILIAHSTLPGCVSFRDPQYGSWYIQALCEVFAERAHNTHVDKLFILVDNRMKEKHENVQTSSVDRWGFNKRLYLHPGLFE